MFLKREDLHIDILRGIETGRDSKQFHAISNLLDYASGLGSSSQSSATQTAMDASSPDLNTHAPVSPTEPTTFFDQDSSRPQSPPSRTVSRRSSLHHLEHSSAEDVSLHSDFEDERAYATDFTTPTLSESAPEDMQPDEVEDFRDREYPQLKGKTYLDHGGTTVGARRWKSAHGVVDGC